MVLKYLIPLLSIVFLAQTADCSETKFQQYTQEFTKPPVYIYDYMSFYYYPRHRSRFFSFDPYYLYQKTQEEKRYLNSSDKNTYVPPEEFKIKPD